MAQPSILPKAAADIASYGWFELLTTSQIRLICGVAKHCYAWVSASIVGVDALNVERKDLYHKLGLQFVVEGRPFAPEVQSCVAKPR